MDVNIHNEPSMTSIPSVASNAVKCTKCEKMAIENGKGYCKQHFIEYKETIYLDNTDPNNLGIIAWARDHLPHYLPNVTPRFHIRILLLLLELYHPFLKNKMERLRNIVSWRGSAKAQSLDSLILTPKGWIKLRYLKEGDYVIGSDGKPTKVIKLHPIVNEMLYKVKTRDNRETICNGGHLWKVFDSRIEKDAVYNTKKLLRTYKYIHKDNRGKWKESYESYHYFLDTVKPIRFKKQELPVDPYVLGLWLGDGHSAGTRLTGIQEDLEYYIQHLEKIGYYHGSFKNNTTSKAKTMSISNVPIDRTGHKECLSKILRDYNLTNNKHIPNIYLFNSLENRIALLQGLIDTDGTVDIGGTQFSFCNKNEQLIDNFLELLRGLGGTGTKTKNCYNGFTSFRVNCRVPEGIIPCQLPRKVSRWKGSIKTKTAITAIEENGIGECRCISIANPDGLYVTDDYMLTHNSTLATMIFPAYLLAHNGKSFKLMANGVVVNCKINEKYICVISETGALAEDFVVRLRDEFLSNKTLRYFYKVQIEDAVDERTGQLTRKAFKFNGCYVLGVGSGMQIRGRIKGAYRVTLMLADDLYSERKVKTELGRKAIRTWWNGAVKNSVDDVMGKIACMGTILHEDTITVDQINNSLWKTELIPLMPLVLFTEFMDNYMDINQSTGECNLPYADEKNEHEQIRKRREYFDNVYAKKDWQISWPDRVNLYMIALWITDAVRTRTLSLLYQEYLHEIVPNSNKRFRKEYFQPLPEYSLIHQDGQSWFYCLGMYPKPVPINLYIGIDTATGTLDGDDSSITVGGVLPDNRWIKFKTVYGKFGMRDETFMNTADDLRYGKVIGNRKYIRKVGYIDEAYRLSQEYNVNEVRVGYAGSEKELVNETRKIFSMNGSSVMVIGRRQLSGEGAKVERIQNTLHSHYSTYSVYHAKGLTKLEYQLEYLGASKEDDVADSAEVCFCEVTPPSWDEYKDKADLQYDPQMEVARNEAMSYFNDRYKKFSRN